MLSPTSTPSAACCSSVRAKHCLVHRDWLQHGVGRRRFMHDRPPPLRSPSAGGALLRPSQASLYGFTYSHIISLHRLFSSSSSRACSGRSFAHCPSLPSAFSVREESIVTRFFALAPARYAFTIVTCIVGLLRLLDQPDPDRRCHISPSLYSLA